MHRPPSFRRRSYAPQLCAAVAFLLLLLLSLSILHIRLSSSPHLLSSSNSSSHVITDDRTDDLDRIDDLDLITDDQKPLTPPSDDPTPNLFWDHSLSVARISFHRAVTTSPSHRPLIPPDLSFASDDEPLDHSVKTQLSFIRHIEDALLIENSPTRDRWAKWLEKKRDFIRRDRMLRSDNHEMLNPRNHPLLQDPDVAGSTGLTRGDRIMQRAVLKEMEGMEGRRRMLDLKGLGFSEFVERFFDGGRCGIRVFMVWNSPEWSFGVRHRRGVESVLYHHRNACVLVFSETVELDFFKEFVDDGYCWSYLSAYFIYFAYFVYYFIPSVLGFGYVKCVV